MFHGIKGRKQEFEWYVLCIAESIFRVYITAKNKNIKKIIKFKYRLLTRHELNDIWHSCAETNTIGISSRINSRLSPHPLPRFPRPSTFRPKPRKHIDSFTHTHTHTLPTLGGWYHAFDWTDKLCFYYPSAVAQFNRTLSAVFQLFWNINPMRFILYFFPQNTNKQRGAGEGTELGNILVLIIKM